MPQGCTWLEQRRGEQLGERGRHGLHTASAEEFNAWAWPHLGATLRVTNLTDGILAEGGFTSWNPVPNTSSARSPPLQTSPGVCPDARVAS